MRFKPFLLGSAAATGILFATAAIEPFPFPLFSQAQAAADVSVSISINTFYDRLEPYGSWISYRDRWVWVPDIEDAHWRPYTRGHWAYTKRHGWLWVSNERFGWATYHYGRWGYARDIGWYWVPGRRWAPAWVAWSRDDESVAWAPLPPGRGDDVSISISIDTMPDYYWQVVPVSAFLEVDLSGHIVRDRDRVRRVISRGEIEPVRIENNIVVNNVINVNFIEEKTEKKVVILEERAADKPESAGKADDNTVAIFNAEVQDEPEAKPKEVKKVEDVAKEREAKGIAPEEGATESAAEGGATTEPKGEAAQGEQPAAEGGQPATEQATEEKKPVEGEQQATEEKKPAEGEQQARKKRSRPKASSRLKKRSRPKASSRLKKRSRPKASNRQRKKRSRPKASSRQRKKRSRPKASSRQRKKRSRPKASSRRRKKRSLPKASKAASRPSSHPPTSRQPNSPRRNRSSAIRTRRIARTSKDCRHHGRRRFMEPAASSLQDGGVARLERPDDAVA